MTPTNNLPEDEPVIGNQSTDAKDHYMTDEHRHTATADAALNDDLALGPLDPNSANFTGGPARAALAAAPQPAIEGDPWQVLEQAEQPRLSDGYAAVVAVAAGIWLVLPLDKAKPDREALVEVIEDALYSHSDERGWELTGTAQSIADALLARGLRLPGGETMTSAARDVLAERQRQINVEGWTPEDDDRYENGDLANAAACYAVHAAEEGAPTDAAPSAWPWDAKWWKPSTPRRDLVKAGALILAEIERLDRAEGDTP